MTKEDNLSNIERREVRKEIDKKIKEKVISHAQAVKSEFKKQVVTAIMAAFGLLIAFAWKDVITFYVTKINFLNGYGLLTSAVFITLISVLGIIFLNQWSKLGEEKS